MLTVAEEQAARKVVDKIMSDPANFERARRLLSKTSKNLLPRILQLLKNRLAAYIAAAGPGAAAVGVTLLWQYLVLSELAAALTIFASAIELEKWYWLVRRRIDHIWDKVREALEKCKRLIGPEEYARILACVSAAYAKFQTVFNRIIGEFNAKHAGKTEAGEAVRIFNGQYMRRINRAWREFIEDVRKCFDDLDCGVKPWIESMAENLFPLLEELTEAIPLVTVPAGGFGVIPEGLSLGFPGGGGYSHDEKVRGDDSPSGIDPATSLIYFSKDELLERKNLIRGQLHELDDIIAGLHRDLDRLAGTDDNDEKDRLRRALENTGNLREALRMALVNTFLECLERVEAGSEEAYRIFLELQALHSKVVLPDTAHTKLKALEAAEREFDEALEAETQRNAPTGSGITSAPLAFRIPVPSPTPDTEVLFRPRELWLEYRQGDMTRIFDLRTQTWIGEGS
ncbi:MAG: hypothetical protein R3B74_01695 [Nitrospirales bacterium]|nr:hypothetical protein [Nitrospirales bacterium]